MAKEHWRHWRIIKWSGIGVLLTVALMVAAIGLGLTWLSVHHSRTQPLNLLPYLPKIQTFFAARGLNITADTLELYYDESPVVRVEGMRILGPDGTLAVYLEQAAVKLANGRLLRFAVSPKVIEAKGMTLRLVRGADDVVRIAGLGLNQNRAIATNEERGVVDWLDDLPADRLWGRLKNVRIEGLTLLLRDDMQQAEWVMERGRFSLDRYEGQGERGTLLATLRRIVGPHVKTPKGVRGLPIPVLVSIERAANGPQSNQVVLEAKFGSLNAAIIGDYLPEALQNLVRGQGTLALGSILTRGNRLGQPWLTLRLKNATLNLPKEAGYAQPFKLPQLEATISYQPSPTDVLTIRNLSFTGPRGNLFVVSGTVPNLTTTPILALSAYSPGGDVQAIIDFFPPENPKMLKTTQWLRTDIKNAHYRNLIAHSTLQPKAFPGCGEHCGGLRIDAELLSGDVYALEGLPPAQIASSPTPARFYWRGQKLAVSAPSATLSGQSAQSVWVSIDNIFSPSPSTLTISGSLVGPLNDVVERLNALPDINGKIPGAYGGMQHSLLHAQIPFPRGISPSFVSTTLTVQGVVKNATLEGLAVLNGKSLSGAKAFINLSPDKTLTINMPNAALDGGALKVQWQQNVQPKRPSAAAITLAGTLPARWLNDAAPRLGISATGALTVNLKAQEETPDDWRFNLTSGAQGAKLNVAALGYAKAAGEPLTLKTEGRFKGKTLSSATLVLQPVQLSGAGVQISGTATLPLSNWVAGQFNFPNLRLAQQNLSASLNNQTLTVKGSTLDLSGMPSGTSRTTAPAGLTVVADLNTVRMRTGSLQNLKLQARGNGQSWNLERLQGNAGGGTVNIQRGGRALNINVANLGGVLSALGVYDRLKGGNLFGALRGPSERLSGELKLNDFELRNPPTLLRILGLLSLEQLVAGTDTTKFTSGVIPLTLTPQMAELNAARFTGPSMDLRLNGSYTRTSQQLNIQGNLAPAIPLNRLVSKIPLLGTLLTGSQDGVVVADFRIKGDAAKPDVHVQPLSVLTPGLLKDLFRGGTPAR